MFWTKQRGRKKQCKLKKTRTNGGNGMETRLMKSLYNTGIVAVDEMALLLEKAGASEDRVDQALSWLELVEERLFGRSLPRCDRKLGELLDIFQAAPRVNSTQLMAVQEYLGRHRIPPLPGIDRESAMNLFELAKTVLEVRIEVPPEPEVPNSRLFL